MSQELAKLVKEQMVETRAVREENRTMKREQERLKGKVERGVLEDSEGEEERNEEEDLWQDRQAMSVDQRVMLEALERVGRKDQRSELPVFSGKLDPKECMDQIEALDNFFECDNTPKSQRVKVEN